MKENFLLRKCLINRMIAVKCMIILYLFRNYADLELYTWDIHRMLKLSIILYDII